MLFLHSFASYLELGPKSIPHNKQRMHSFILQHRTLSVRSKKSIWAKFHITSQGMQEHRTFISLLLKIEIGPNFTLQAKKSRNIEHFASKNLFKFHITTFIITIDFWPKSILRAKKCRKIEPLSVRSLKSIFCQIRHYKQRNAESSYLYQFDPKN